ncbi:hypothetical protein APT92_21520, partial [Klebsiella pneumoniae]
SLNKYFTAGAQCFPRLACPLQGSVFMQVHRGAQAAPGQGPDRNNRARKRMQDHAPCGCMA